MHEKSSRGAFAWIAFEWFATFACACLLATQTPLFETGKPIDRHTQPG